MHTLVDLPGACLARVLSFLPFSKNKVAAQGLCKQWRDVLCHSAAHTTDTFGEDEPLDVDPHRPPRLGEGLLQALCCLTLFVLDQATAEDLRWLPMQLTALGINDMNQIRLLSGEYKHVTTLRVTWAADASEAAAQSLVIAFCNVLDLTLTELESLPAETARKLFPVLQQLNHLQRFEVCVQHEAVDLQPARSDCVIKYTLLYFNEGSQDLRCLLA